MIPSGKSHLLVGGFINTIFLVSDRGGSVCKDVLTIFLAGLF